MTAVRPLLLIETATDVAVLALGDGSSGLLAVESWSAGYRHGEELLARLDALLARSGIELGDLGGVVVGTGPGAFTGLRVGLATAKGLAWGMGLPIAGVSSGAGLIDAARTAGLARPVILLPAGPNDRVVVIADGAGIARAQRLPAGAEPELPTRATVVSIDLEGRAPADELARAAAVRSGLPAAMLRLGAARLAAGGDDLATLVPEYVSPPRGVVGEGGPVTLGHA